MGYGSNEKARRLLVNIRHIWAIAQLTDALFIHRRSHTTLYCSRSAVVSLAVNATRSSASSVGSGGREQEPVAAVGATGGRRELSDDVDDPAAAGEKRSRSLSRSSQHSSRASDDAEYSDDRSRASYGVRFAAVSSI